VGFDWLIFSFLSRSGVLMKELEILDKLLNNNYDRRATPTNHLSKLH